MNKGKRPITPEDLATAPTLDEPRLSPDGTRVAFVVGEESREGLHPRSAIFTVAVEGEAPARRFTQGAACDKAPRWSPDGRWLAFLSDRAEPGKAQAYLMAADGGEAELLAPTAGPVEDLEWAPGGGSLALRVGEGESEEEKRRARERDDAAEFGTQWKNARIWLLDLADRVPAPLTTAERHACAFAWSPDAARLAVISQESSWEDAAIGPLQLAIYLKETGGVEWTTTVRGHLPGSAGRRMGHGWRCSAARAVSIPARRCCRCPPPEESRG